MSIDELVQTIYQDNFSHFDFIDNMGAGDCDCKLHITLDTIMEYTN
jgi:Uri superfamily endonuclease